MNDPINTRALVIDDHADEASPVLQALQLLGMTCLFYDGGVDFPFPEKLGGPRLLLLDMVLGEHGARADDTKSCNEVLLAALGRAINFENGPFLVIAWTAHPEMMSEFEEEFKKRFANHSTTVFLTGKKPSEADFHKPETLNKLKALIQQGLEKFGLVGLLIEWECIVSGAAKQTTNRLFGLGKETCESGANQDQVLNQINFLCGTLAFAEGGMRVANGKINENILSLLNVLHHLLVDRLEHIDPPPTFGKAYGELIKSNAGVFLQRRKKQRAEAAEHEAETTALFRIWETLGCDIASSCASPSKDTEAVVQREGSRECVSALNTMLLISSSFDGKAMQPGNLYLGGVAANSVGAATFSTDLVLKNSFLVGKQQPAELVFIECTPACDFVQNKRALPRCVAGLLVSAEGLRNMPSGAEFLRFLGPVLIPKSKLFPEQPVWLVINSHFVTSFTPEALKQQECIGRLRSHALADIISWLAGHMARPGYVSI